MHDGKGFYWFVVVLSFVLLLGCFSPATNMKDNNTYLAMNSSETVGNTHLAGIPHAPIAIDGDANFSITAGNEGWLGDGSSGDPYIIDGLDIDLGGAAGHCISITNTRVNFTISNCNLTGANVNPGSGIYLNNVTNGKIIGNTFLDDFYAIQLSDCDHNTIEDNICDANSSSIYIQSGESNVVNNNTCYDNDWYGIALLSTEYNNVTDNTCYNNTDSGIFSTFSYRNLITNNTCYDNGYGILVHETQYTNVTWNSLFNNTANGGDTGANNFFDYNYWSHYNGDDLDGDGVGDTPCLISGNQDLHPLMAPPGSLPIWLQSITDHVIFITEPFIYDLNASVYGGLDYWWINDTANFVISQSGIITNSTSLPANDYGLSVHVNDTLGNVLTGIFTVTVTDAVSPVWIELPTTQVIEVGSRFYYNLNASDYSGLDTWWINDTMHFSIDTSGVIVNNTHLPGDTYGLQVWVNDTFGNILNTTFNVIVVDAIGPIWIEPPLDQEIEEGAPFIYTLDATDLSGLHIWWVNDTDHFAVDEYGVITNITALSEGVYPCEVWVNDTSGNTLTGIFTLTIHAALPPTWISVPLDQVVEFGESLSYDLDVSDISDIGSWWLNVTTYFTIDQDGTITNSIPLVVGIYSLLVSVSDTLGNTQSSEITISVEDTTAPSWVQMPVDQVIEYGEHLSYDLNVTDLSEIEDWWVDDTARFSVDWIGQVRTLEILEPGTYGLQIYVSDIHGNTLMASILIEVIDTTSPTTSPIPDGFDPIMTLVLGAGIGGTVVLVFVIVFLRRKS